MTFQRTKRVFGSTDIDLGKFQESSPRSHKVLDVIPGEWPALPYSPVAFLNVSRPPQPQPVMREISKHYGATYIDFEVAEQTMAWSSIDKILLGPAMNGIAKVIMGKMLDKTDLTAVALDVPPSTNNARYALTKYAWQRGAASVVGVWVPDNEESPDDWSGPSTIEDFTVIWRIVN